MKLKVLTMLSMLVSVVVVDAAVNIDNFISGNRITRAQFNNAMNAAANSGNEIIFSARNYTVSQDLFVTQPGLTITGAGKNATTITWGADIGWSMFSIRANNVRIQGMKMTGKAFPTYNNNPYSIVGSSVKTGLSFAVRIHYRWVRNLQVYGCKMEKVDVGIGAVPGTRYSGLRCGWNDFITGRGSVWVLSQRNDTAAREREAYASPMIIRANRLIYHPGQATQGIALDYGVVPAVGEKFPVDLKGSIIRDNNCDRIIFWQVGATRVSNIDIFGNTFRGGGQGPKAAYVHCIHLEEGITGMNIYNNTLNQWRQNTNGALMNSVSIITSTAPKGTIWPKVNFYNNTCTGSVNAVLLGGLRNWSITNNTVNVGYNNTWVSGWKRPSTATVSGNRKNGVNIDSQIYLNN